MTEVIAFLRQKKGRIRTLTMVDVAQLVELRIVIPAVVGSSPIVHPRFDSGSVYSGRY